MPHTDTLVTIARPRRRRTVTIAIAVALIAAAMAATLYFAIPAWQQHQRHARALAVAADVQRFVPAFHAYVREHGDWPPAAVPGAIPSGMETWLHDAGWTAAPAIGGHYQWLIDAGGVHAGISIVPSAATTALDLRDVQEVMRTLQAAGFPTTRLRLNARNEPMFVLEN